MVATHAQLIAPVNLGLFRLRLAREGRVFLFLPALRRRRIAFVGAAQRLLRREAPTLQVAANRADQDVNAVALRDQVAHRFARPEGEGQLELVRRAIRAPLDAGRRLLARPTRRRRPAALLRAQRIDVAEFDPRQPGVERSARDAEGPRGNGFFQAAPDRRPGAKPNLLLRGRRERARVALGQVSSITREFRNVQYYMS